MNIDKKFAESLRAQGFVLGTPIQMTLTGAQMRAMFGDSGIREMKLDGQGRPIMTADHLFDNKSQKAHSTLNKDKVLAQFATIATKVQNVIKTEGWKALKDLSFFAKMYVDLPEKEVELVAENVIGLQYLFDKLTLKEDKKFLLCRTITSAVNGLWVEVVVEDPSGEGAAILRLVNFTPPKYSQAVAQDVAKWFKWLPTGTILAVKHTWMEPFQSSASAKNPGVVRIQCHNPSNVVLLSPKKAQEMVPGLVWKGSIIHQEKGTLWDRIKIGDSAGKIMEDIKRTGNTAFASNRFTDALRWYEVALDYADVNVEAQADILSNKAAGLLGLGCFLKALEACDYVLALDPARPKAVLRKVRALIGLGRGDEAADFLQEKLAELNNNKDLLELRAKLITLEDLVKLPNAELLSPSVRDHFADYIGPVERRPLHPTNRGLFATQDIQFGQLLIFQRFIAHVPVVYRTAGQHCSEEELIRIIANKVTFCPETAAQIYQLWPGNKLADENAHLLRRVDMKRIRKIVYRNNVDIDTAQNQTICYAVTPIQAQVNHSCVDANVHVRYVGNSVVVRASKPIKKGDQLLTQWISPSHELSHRNAMFKKLGLTCNCRLCQQQEKLDENTKKYVELFWTKMENVAKEQYFTSPEQVTRSMSIIQHIERLTSGKLEFNFKLITQEVQDLMGGMLVQERFSDYATLAEKVFVASESAGVYDIAGRIAEGLAFRYIKRRDASNAKIWMKNWKNCCLIEEGHSTVVWGNLSVARGVTRDDTVFSNSLFPK